MTTEKEIGIKKIVLVKHGGPDRLMIETTMPPAVYPYDHNATLILEVAKGSGESYCRDNFSGVAVEVIDEK